jgi:hypothetical protein
MDLNGDGINLTSPADGVLFRMDPNGAPVQVAWTGQNSLDAWLALDRNGNGTIDNASELFGSATLQPVSDKPNGYAALQVFDSAAFGGNDDGRIDASDAVYRQLRVWIDRNHNGFSESAELFSLPEAGVLSISLKYSRSSHMDQFGNVFMYKSEASINNQYTEGRDICYDVFLKTNN